MAEQSLDHIIIVLILWNRLLDVQLLASTCSSKVKLGHTLNLWSAHFLLLVVVWHMVLRVHQLQVWRNQAPETVVD